MLFLDLMQQFLHMVQQVIIIKKKLPIFFLGSGKTFTMIGTPAMPGLMTLLTQSLYDKINLNEFTVYISLLVIFKLNKIN